MVLPYFKLLLNIPIMKKSWIILILVAATIMAFKNDTTEQQKGLLSNTEMVHIGIVVKDIETSIDKWTLLLGLEKRPSISIAEGHEANPTHYRGKPSNAKAKLAFMSLENLNVELIEPIGNEQSHWKEFLETKGEGVHHVAFQVKDMGTYYLENFEKNGLPLVQHGGWNGGEYGYMDGMESLGVMIELLETYDK